MEAFCQQLLVCHGLEVLVDMLHAPDPALKAAGGFWEVLGKRLAVLWVLMCACWQRFMCQQHTTVAATHPCLLIRVFVGLFNPSHTCFVGPSFTWRLFCVALRVLLQAWRRCMRWQ